MRLLASCLFVFLLFPASLTIAAVGENTPDSSPPEAARVTPDKKAELDALFQTLRSTKDKDEAKSAETRILALWLDSGSDTIDLLMNWVIGAIEDKDYAAALDLLDRVTSMKPDYAEGWNKRASVYFLLDDYSKSASDIRRTLALEPRHFGALSGLGMIIRSLGDNKGAMAAYRQALEFDPFLDNVREALEEMEKKAAGRDI
jgi:tetratricopeptide (TPR) repeat protein